MDDTEVVEPAIARLPALPDPRQAARAVDDAIAGFGPLERHLDDLEVEEIWINGRLPPGFATAAVGPTRRRSGQGR